MKVSSHLVILGVIALLPVVAFSAMLIVLVAGRGQVPPRPLWLVLAAGGALLSVGVALAIVFGRRLSREREDAGRENARLLAEAERAREASDAARQDADFLAGASTVLAASLEYEATLRQLASLAVRRLADWCVIDVVGERGVTHRVATAHADPAMAETAASLMRFPPGANPGNPVEQALAAGQLVTASDVTAEGLERMTRDAEHLAIVRRLGVRAYVMVPLVARGRTLGVVSFIRAADAYGPRDLALAQDLAQRAAGAIDNARLYTETQAASRGKDDFLAMLSHELRTPLTSVLGWTGLLRRGRLDEATAARALETIERNARLQTQLVEDLLDVSAIVTGNLRPDVERLDLLGVATAAVESVRSAAAAKRIHVEARCEPVGLVSGDPARLQQVVVNLLSNALKFLPEGGRIDVTLTGHDNRARLSVSDTGRGIAPEFLPHVFEHFRQADAATTRSYRGLGLGLAIVRHIVELHDGTVRAASAGAGQGATFTVELPTLSIEPAGGEPSPRPTPAESGPTLDGTTVLVVEDDPDARELLQTILERRGARVVAVESAAAGRAALGRTGPDVVVSDIMMPDEDGYQFVRWLRAEDAIHGRRTPAVALTAYASADDRARVLAAGYDMHLAKPVEPGALVRAVASAAAARGQRR